MSEEKAIKMTVAILNDLNQQIDDIITALKNHENSSQAIDSLLTTQQRVNTIYQDENKRNLQPSGELLSGDNKPENEVKKHS